MTPSLESRLKSAARSLGFELAGIAPASDADGFDRLAEWLARGYAGEMAYLHQHEQARRHPSSVLPEVRSVLMLGMNYGGQSSDQPGRIARYAQGNDYHDLIRERLNRLLVWLQNEVPECIGRGVVDTAPLLERDFARRAGLGWIGKNTLLINRKQGSFLFLAALLTNLDLKPDAPFTANHCGSCTRCLDACPTDAFTSAGWLDARKCISYLTIELRSPIPDELRPGVGGWLFGCDVCQDVCPWNRRDPLESPTFPHRDDLEVIDPLSLFTMDESAFRTKFRGTAITRTKRRGLLRNAAIVIGNTGDDTALPVLRDALKIDDAMVREAVEWAIREVENRHANSNNPPT